MQFPTRLEYRAEDGIGLAQDCDAWALSASCEYCVKPKWLLLTNLDALYFENSAASSIIISRVRFALSSIVMLTTLPFALFGAPNFSELKVRSNGLFGFKRVVSRFWWKFSSGVLRACGFGPDQAA
ncbi:hypothetical protein ACEWPL_019250, partial [Roseovarius sp. S1116L3]|uniref:hypothetical protein n=1 Tax=Roseovarius roseus TaxID=3342636 RepID=UPI003B672EB4